MIPSSNKFQNNTAVGTELYSVFTDKGTNKANVYKYLIIDTNEKNIRVANQNVKTPSGNAIELLYKQKNFKDRFLTKEGAIEELKNMQEDLENLILSLN